MLRYRLPLLLLAFANLLFGILAGLVRMGWECSLGTAAVHHGSIMVGAFLGTLILIEKIIPLKRTWLLVFPAVNALGILMVVPAWQQVGRISILIGALSLVAVFIVYYKRQPHDLSSILMLIGALCQVAGHVMLFRTGFYPMAFPWWMAFILFIIVAERLELSKFLPVTSLDKRILIALLALFVVGLVLPFHGVGKYLSGIALFLIVLWLLRHDVIRVGMRKSGLPKYSAYTLLTGYISLMITAVFMLALPDLPYAYDAIVHTFFLGFAFAMIFAHGAIILPGVLGIAVRPFHPILYVFPSTMSFAVLLRVLADLNFIASAFRLVSGWISMVTILGYFITLAFISLYTFRIGKAL